MNTPNRRVKRLALLGGESSGKTSLAQALAKVLQTAWVPEYGRELWEEKRVILSVPELVQVARTQVAREEQHLQMPGPQSSGWLVCDTTPLTTLQYCLYDHAHAPPELHALAQRHYELFVVCQPDFDFVQDGARRDSAFRAQQHAWTMERLADMQVQPLCVKGELLERVQQVQQHLAELPSFKLL
jgi:HTH-type transcriptional regulator, transcriptional repressor of NAD biosynthesis genes